MEDRHELKDVKVYSDLTVVGIDKAPEPLSVICLGMEKQLGSAVFVSYEDVPTKARILVSDDPFLNIFSAIDIVIIVQIVLSLFVILIAYDAISGEREGGTLALVMSNSVSRYHVLIGKYLGGMASIMLPLSIGWLAGLAVIRFSHIVEFHVAEWGRFCLLFLVSTLYISVFFLLSMLVSAKSKRSATALVWMLFLWVVLVLVIPNVAVYLAGQIRPIESEARVDAERKSIMEEFGRKIEDYERKYGSRIYIRIEAWANPTGDSPFARRVLTGSKEAILWYLDGNRFYVPLSIEYAERMADLEQRHYRSLKKQTTLAENLSRLSPGWVYYNTSAVIAGTDLGRYERFIKRAQDYRRELMEYIRGQGAFGTLKWFTRVNLDELPSQAEIMRDFEGKYYDMRTHKAFEAAKSAFLEKFSDRLRPKSWDEVEPLDLSGVPVFTFERESAITAIGRALPDLMILILENALLFLGAAAIFLKSEVR
jgi:ABC-type transport system involved in multi-copper enzyme maturation permease subunit